MKIALLILIFALPVFAQTNAPAKQKHAITLADVQAGLTTISNRIAVLNAYQQKITAGQLAEEKRLNLQSQLKQITESQRQDAMAAYISSIDPTCRSIRQELAALKLEDLNIRQRYGIP